jgi:hypothetical protein
MCRGAPIRVRDAAESAPLGYAPPSGQPAQTSRKTVLGSGRVAWDEEHVQRLRQLLAVAKLGWKDASLGRL